jgi:hypothetical protein
MVMWCGGFTWCDSNLPGLETSTEGKKTLMIFWRWNMAQWTLRTVTSFVSW